MQGQLNACPEFCPLPPKYIFNLHLNFDQVAGSLSNFLPIDQPPPPPSPWAQSSLGEGDTLLKNETVALLLKRLLVHHCALSFPRR